MLLAIPLVAGASWAGATYYTGAQTQSAYDQLLAELNELKPLTLVNETYHAGMMNSTAVTKVMDSTSPDANVLFRLHHDIHHSPIGVNDGAVNVAAATIKTKLLIDESLPKEAMEIIGNFFGSDPFVIDSYIGFDGSMRNVIQVNAYQSVSNDMTIRFDGVDYTVNVNGNTISGAGSIGNFDVVTSDNNGKLRLSPGAVTTNLTRVSSGLYTGDYGVNFEKLSVSSDDLMFDVALKDIGIQSDTQINNNKLHSKGGFSIGAIDSPLPFNSASINTSIENINASGFEQFVEMISQVPLTDLMTSEDPDKTGQILNAYKSLIGPGSAVNYDIKLSNTGGKASIGYGISVLEETSPYYPANGLDSLETVRDLMNVVTLNAYLDADAGAVDLTPLGMFMMMPEAQQYILADGIKYKSDITVSNLIVDINGDPLSLEMMMGDMLEMPLSELMSM